MTCPFGIIKRVAAEEYDCTVNPLARFVGTSKSEPRRRLLQNYVLPHGVYLNAESSRCLRGVNAVASTCDRDFGIRSGLTLWR